VREAGGQHPIRGGRPDDPDHRDPVGRAFIHDRSQIGRLRRLAVRASDCSAQIAKRVPGFLDDQHAVACISNTDIDRVPRVCGPGRQFECGGAARPPGQVEQSLLHRQMAGVAWSAGLTWWPGERDRQRLSKDHAERDPQLECHSLTVTELDPADPSLANADPVAQLGLGQAKIQPCAPDHSTKRRRENV
jgi:hypothetical protein